MIYKGCIFNGKRECYGESFYENSVTEYKGSYYNDMRHGWGELFDREGGEIYAGLWYCGKNYDFTVSINESDFVSNKIHSFMEEFIISHNCCNELLSLKLIEYDHLKKIAIGNNSLKKVYNLIISSCPMLQSLVIGDNCATNEFVLSGDNDNVLLSIQQCKQLNSIIIGEHSFIHYQSFLLKRSLFVFF